MEHTGSGLLKSAFMAVAGCVVVHSAFSFIALTSGVDLWSVLGTPLTDGMVSIFNSAFAGPAYAGTIMPPIGAESFIPPIENTLEPGCHMHLDGTKHCGSDLAVEW